MKGKGGLSSPPSVDIPLVYPGINYDGTPLSNGGPFLDSDIAWVTGKPAAKWLKAPGFVLFQDEVIIIDACAYAEAFDGGIAGASVKGDCVETELSALTLYEIPNPRGGAPKVRLGWMFKLPHAEWMALGSAGSARLFVEVRPSVAGLQNRVIGNSVIDGSQRDWVMNFLPRATEFDHVVTIGAGQDYATIGAAATAINTAGTAKRVCIRAIAGWHEADNGPPAGNGSFLEARTVITSDDPDNPATFGREADYDPEDMSANNWRVGLNALEYRNINIDTRNLRQPVGVGPALYNGAFIGNSEPVETFATYWNAGSKPTWTTVDGSGIPFYDMFVDSFFEKQGNVWNFRGLVLGCSAKDILGSPLDNTCMAVDVYMENINSEIIRFGGAGLPIIEITGPANSTVSITPGGDTTSGEMLLKVLGVTQHTLVLGYKPSLGNIDGTALAATINGLGLGWSAVAKNQPFLGCRYLHAANDVSVTSAHDFNALGDVHVEDLHVTVPNTQNILFRNVVTGGTNKRSSSILRVDTSTTDMWILNYHANSNVDFAGVGGFGANGIEHSGLRGSFMDGGFDTFGDVEPTFSQIYASIVGFFSIDPETNVWAGNLLKLAGAALPGHPVGLPANVEIATVAELFENKATDPRPKAGSAMTTNVLAMLDPYDANHELRAEIDAPGAFKIGGSVYSPPAFPTLGTP